MTEIEVPDWVAAVALEAYTSSRGSYEGEVPPDLGDMRAALTAALGAWVVPLIRAAEDEVERRPLSTHKLRAALTALRQEKPE